MMPRDGRQSITAANLLGEVAHLVLPQPYSTAFAAFGVVYGVPEWGFAALWAGLATALTYVLVDEFAAIAPHIPALYAAPTLRVMRY